jgi:tellurite resistance protein TerA
MQRIISGTPIDEQTLENYEQSLAVLCRHFPPLITSLFATARRSRDGHLEWWSEREGQPIPLSALPAIEQAVLQEKCQRRQEAIRQLAEELARRGEPALAERLHTLLKQTPQLTCYGINGEPVLVHWGIPPQPAEPMRLEEPIRLVEPAPRLSKGRWITARHLGCLAAMLLALLLGILLLRCWPTLFPTDLPSGGEPLTELTKEQPSVSLAKQHDFGRIRVSLNWTNPSADSAIDLDVAAFVRLKNQKKTGVEALSRLFGDYNNAPYVALEGDDRSGVNSHGEWLFINGSHWQQIDEVLIYAFIYSGASNWQSTQATTTIHIPGQPSITTRLTEGGNDRPVGVIARLINVDGTIKVERINQYFDDRESVDRAFGWGLEWHPIKGKS